MLRIVLTLSLAQPKYPLIQAVGAAPDQGNMTAPILLGLFLSFQVAVSRPAICYYVEHRANNEYHLPALNGFAKPPIMGNKDGGD
jgi:hypothetical protein